MVAVDASLPRISIVCPARNEERVIRQSLRSIVENGYPGTRLEVIVADGMSTDRTREIVAEVASEYEATIRLIDNPGRIMPSGANLGIQAATGDVIFLLNSHSRYAPGYFERCVRTLQEQGADCVSGIIGFDNSDDSFWSPAIRMALSHPFGVGNSRYRLATSREEPFVVDSAGFAGVRREVFERVGLYNEVLKHSQDQDLHARIAAAGFVTMIDPRARATYYHRTSFSAFLKYVWRNGVWITVPMRLTRTRFRPRHFTPGAVFLLGILLVLASLVSREGRVALATLSGLYALLAVVFSLRVALTEGPVRVAWTGPVMFFLQHLVMGAGTWWGLVVPLDRELKRRARTEPAPRLEPRGDAPA